MRVKFLFKFGMKEHMKDFLQDGKLYMGTFKSYRDNENIEIGDKNEGAYHIGVGGNATFSALDSVNGKFSHIGALEDVTVRVFPDKSELYRVFCMYRVVTDYKEVIALSSILNSELLENFNYDSFVIIADVHKFYSRIDSYMASRKIKHSRDIVTYKDLSVGADKLTPYIKDKRFQQQSEYRVCVENVSGQEPLELCIGSLGDIGAMYKTEDIDSISIIMDNTELIIMKK